MRYILLLACLFAASTIALRIGIGSQSHRHKISLSCDRMKCIPYWHDATHGPRGRLTMRFSEPLARSAASIVSGCFTFSFPPSVTVGQWSLSLVVKPRQFFDGMEQVIDCVFQTSYSDGRLRLTFERITPDAAA